MRWGTDNGVPHICFDESCDRFQGLRVRRFIGIFCRFGLLGGCLIIFVIWTQPSRQGTELIVNNRQVSRRWRGDFLKGGGQFRYINGGCNRAGKSLWAGPMTGVKFMQTRGAGDADIGAGFNRLIKIFGEHSPALPTFGALKMRFCFGLK